ncbi:MAG: 1-acyl-sn-glycerol-3-phosphate acyltransferase [Rhodobacteraceae bacterium]|nr:1-acyl-sn-glycerol-3-phosphate acyltransferase [Paracoccaceae bacterium]
MSLLVFGGLGVLLVVRVFERPLFGADRPVTPWITRAVCRGSLRIIGISVTVKGKPATGQGAVVSNHASWLDIFALNACQAVYFVSKAEVARWPLIGWLASATGTVFITRDPRQARAQQALFETRIRAGHRLLFFPEGTSTDGLRVLPFKPTLFAAFYSHGLDHVMQIQPVSLAYRAPKGRDPRFYGWWAEMEFAPHLMKVLSSWRQGSVRVEFHDPVAVDAFADRKALAQYCEGVIAGAVGSALGGDYAGR